jgi:hypothetical protein
MSYWAPPYVVPYAMPSGYIPMRYWPTAVLPETYMGRMRKSRKTVTPNKKSGGGRLKKIKSPLYRKKRIGMAPLESATDFAIGTIRLGQDGMTYYRIIRSGLTRRWVKVAKGATSKRRSNAPMRYLL